MKRFKVRKETTTVSPLRDLETGRVIVRNVYTTSGQMIVKAGTPLTDKLRMRLKEFGIRRVAVKTTTEEWVSRTEKESTECEVLEEETIQEESKDQLEQLEAIEDPNELLQRLQLGEHELRRDGGAADGRELRELLGRLFQLNEVEESLRDDLAGLENVENSSALWDAISTIQSPDAIESNGDVPESLIKDILELVDERRDVKGTLVDEYLDGSAELSEAIGTGLTASSDGETSSGDVPSPVELISTLLEDTEAGENQDTGLHARLRKRGQSFVEEEEDRFDLKQDVFTKVHEESMRSHFLDVLDGIRDPDDPIPESAQEEFQHQTELNRRVKNFRKEQQQRREKLADVLDEAEFKLQSDDLTIPGVEDLNDRLGPQLPSLEDGIEPPEIEMDELDAMLEDIEAEPARESPDDTDPGLRGILNELAERDTLPDPVRSKLDTLLTESEQLDEKTDSLTTLLENDGFEEDVFEKIESLMFGELPENPEVIDTFDMDETSLEKLRDHINQKDRHFKRWVGLLEDTLKEENLDEELRSTIHRSVKHLEAKRTNFDRAKLFLGDEQDGAEVQQREELLDEILDTERASWIARYTDLSRSVVETALWFFSKPEKLDERKRELFDLAREILDDTLFRQRLRPDLLDTYVQKLRSLIDDTSRVIKLLESPRIPSEYGLNHGYNVSLLVTYLADPERFDDRDVRDAVFSALTQDTGMVVLSLRDVLEGGTFTEKMQQHVRRHPAFSRRILGRTKNIPERAEVAAGRHHERTDQSGYPDGLSEEDLDAVTGLVQVCDAYAAMLEDRPYRSQLAPDEALRTLAGNKQKYDSRAIKSISQKIGPYPKGSFVLLTDGRLALVRQQHSSDVAKPNVMVIADENRNRLSNPEPVKLNQRSVGVRKLLKW